MTGINPVWAFTATDDAVSRWLSMIDRLPSCMHAKRVRSSTGCLGFKIPLHEQKESVALLNVHPASQLWALVTSSVYAPVFHWLLRLSGGTCLPWKIREVCQTRMVASEVATRDIMVEQGPNIMQTSASISPQSDLAITTYEIRDQHDGTQEICAYWAKTGSESYLVISVEDLFSEQVIVESLLTNWRPIRYFPACNEIPSEFTFKDIYQYDDNVWT